MLLHALSNAVLASGLESRRLTVYSISVTKEETCQVFWPVVPDAEAHPGQTWEGRGSPSSRCSSDLGTAARSPRDTRALQQRYLISPSFASSLPADVPPLAGWR